MHSNRARTMHLRSYEDRDVNVVVREVGERGRVQCANCGLVETSGPGSNPDGRAPAVARVSFPRKNAVGRSIGRGTMRANGCKGENGPTGGARGWAPRAPMAHRQKAAPVSPLK